ncbi:MAG: protein-glutamate O-methyltransferase [Aquificaceae bacterium]|nr:protein-glutamate O-methyltransferase [Aquificaceae bacterium]
MRVEGGQPQEYAYHRALQQLRLIEQKVKAHEMAHKAVGGPYAGAVQYSYTYGPDGKLYITGGEVSIDLSEESSPEDTIKKMQVVRAAALAPADPSPQDYRVAMQATMKEMKARLELQMQRKETEGFELKV